MSDSVSVVIPLYNKEKYISRTLSSVLSQTYSKFECIIVDSSDDRSTETVKKFTDPRIRHLVQEKRTYPPIARNIGVTAAKYNLVAFIDADDEWAPDHLEALVNLYSRFPKAGIFATPYIKLRQDGTEMTMMFAGIPKPPWEGYIKRYFHNSSRGDVPISSSSCAIRKDVFNEMNGFEESLIHGGEDHHLWGRVALKYPVAFTWKGPGIYHTEASGRMCNDIKPFIGDPLSQYLAELLRNGSIPHDLENDINSYIKRREKTTWFSKITQHYSQESNNNSERMGTVRRLNIPYLSELITKLKEFFLSCYHSGFFNFSRKIWCKLHGWHVPKLEK